jgi:hypothetical protein
MSARRAGTLAVAGVVATTLLVVVLAAWASSIGPRDVLRGAGPAPRTVAPTASEASPTANGTASDLTRHRRPTPSWVGVVAVLLDVAVAVAVVALVLRFAVPLVRDVRRERRARRDRRRRGHAHDPGDVEFTAVTPPEAVAREILADADAQRRLLADGPPRNAVVACWQRFEAHGAAAGIERHPWETSSEYTLRLLELVDAHQPAVTRLGELYREARFSEHDVTEADRQAALEALDRVHRTIGVPA